MFLRFNLRYRIEHWVLAVNFTILAVTGLVQMFSSSHVSLWIIDRLGSIEIVRHTHHICAIIMIVETLIHIGFVKYRVYVTMSAGPMVPGWNDVITAFQAFRYNLGFESDKPKEGRYTFAEKAEYWAVVWGTLIMVLTGFIMWNPIAFSNYFTGEIVPAAKVAHGLEAVLAVLAIIVWHFYFVLIKRFNPSMFNGYLSKEDMAEEHPLELADIMSGRDKIIIDETARKRYFAFVLPQYIIICVFILSATFYFATFEETALAMIEPIENVEVFSRPTIGDPEILVTWDSHVRNIFAHNCGSCHGDIAVGGLNLIDYDKAMASGKILASDIHHSPIMRVLESGNHPHLLSTADLALVHVWISHGAPREGGEWQPSAPEDLLLAGEETDGESSGISWTSVISGIFSTKCGGCHGTGAMGGLNLTDYQAAMDFGAFVPGDVEASRVMIKMDVGGHMASLTDQDMNLVRVWIESGAPEEGGIPVVQEEEVTGTGLTWGTGIADILSASCGGCHGAGAMGGLNLTNYQAAVDKRAIVPGNSSSSGIIRKMEAGGHMGQLSDADLEAVRDWIDAGAPAGNIQSEEPEDESEEITEESVEEISDVPELVWTSGIADIFAANCSTCHSAAAMGGLNLTDYQAVMDKGVIVPGNPDTSRLLQKIEGGAHMGHLSSLDFATVSLWIENGAEYGEGGPVTVEPEAVEEVTEIPGTESEESTETETDQAARETRNGIPLYYWDADIQDIFTLRCTACHGAAAVAGLDFRTYESLMSSDVVVPENPDASLLIEKIEVEDHPGTLTTEEISLIRAWIWNGALQNENSAGVGNGPDSSDVTDSSETAYTWTSDISSIFMPTCTGCHGAGAAGGLNLTSYQSIMDKGVIDTDDPGSSLLINKVQSGTHFASLVDEQIQMILEWITQGAHE